MKPPYPPEPRVAAPRARFAFGQHRDHIQPLATRYSTITAHQGHGRFGIAEHGRREVQRAEQLQSAEIAGDELPGLL